MPPVVRYIFKRVMAAIPVVIGISIIAFMLGVIAPGDPAREVLSMDGISAPTAQDLAKMRQELGLDKPLYLQYGSWLSKAVTGDLGRSYMTGEAVTGEILRRLPVTFSVSLLAVFLVLLFGISLAILMVVKKDSFLDHIGRILALALVSIPGFWLAILLMTFFAEKLHLLPTSGYGTFKHLLMPSFVLSAGTIGVIMRLNRATLLEVLNQNYIITAEAKGLPQHTIIFKHALLNSLIPVLTLIGNYFGSILGGSVIVEVIFALPGIGSFAVDGIFRRDYPVIQGYVVFTGLIFVFFNLLIDLSYVILDPQIRLGGKAE